MKAPLPDRRSSETNDDLKLPIALVLGEIDLVRALQIAGVRCALAATPGSRARYSRGVSRVVDRVDGVEDEDRLLERLIAFAAEQAEPPVLFYDSDSDLLFISRQRERLADVFRFAVAEAALVESLVDKHRFQELAAELGLPVPRSQLLSVRAGVRPDLDLPLPVVVKPLTRHADSWRSVSSSKAVYVDSRAALDDVVSSLNRHGVDAVMQEAVPGGEERVESYHVYVAPENRIAGEFTGRKLRTYPPRFGYSTALVITDEPDVRELGRSVVRDLNLRGVAKLDFKRDLEGRLWLLEVNPRFNLWHHPGAVAGVNLPWLVYADLIGAPRPRAVSARPGVTWCVLRGDYRAARAHGLSRRDWVRFVSRCEAISGFAWNDPAPLVKEILARAQGRLRRAARR